MLTDGFFVEQESQKGMAREMGRDKRQPSKLVERFRCKRELTVDGVRPLLMLPQGASGETKTKKKKKKKVHRGLRPPRPHVGWK